MKLPLIGPFGKAQANAIKFCQNMHRGYIFMELLEEMSAVEEILKSGSEEEKLLAQIVHDQLEQQLNDMIGIGEKNGHDGKRASL